MNRRILDWSLVAAVGTMIAWGMNFAFVKYVLDHLGVGAFMFLRFAVLPLLGLAAPGGDLPAPHARIPGRGAQTCRASSCARSSATCSTSAR